MALLADHKETDRITDKEFTALRQMLKLLRDKRRWVNEFVEAVALRAEVGKTFTVRSLVGDLIEAWRTDPENTDSRSGILTCIGEQGGHEGIDADEFLELRNYLAVMRTKGWLANRMAVECGLFAKGKRYTPAEVIQHMIGFEASDFAENIDSARDLLRDYPKFFQDELRAVKRATAQVPAKKARKRHAAA